LKFEYPLFLVLPILYIVCYKLCPPKRAAILFPHVEYASKLTSNYILQFLIIVCSAIALANPYIPITSIDYKNSDAIVLSIDSSGSMANDNKFGVVKQVAKSFVSQRGNDKLGLVIFGTNAFIASPLTYDKDFIKDILQRSYVSIAGEQTAIMDSLLQSIRMLRNTKAKSKIIILLTDGMDNSSKVSLNTVIKAIKKYHIKVYTIGIGDANYPLLQYLAQISHAKSYYASIQNLAEIYQDIDKLEKSPIQHKHLYKKTLFMYPLALAIILMLFMIRPFRMFR